MARNVIFSEDSDSFFKHLDNKANNDQVKRYIKSNLRNWIIDNYKAKLHHVVKSDPFWVKFADKQGDQVFDIDISAKDKATFERWVDFLNKYENPDTLFRLSIPKLMELVKNWKNPFAGIKDKNKDGVKLIYTYPDGYTWVELLNKDTLMNECDDMDIEGDDLYDKMKDKYNLIFSLRDANDKPHVLLRYNPYDKIVNQTIGELAGKKVKVEYLPYIRNFLKKIYKI